MTAITTALDARSHIYEEDAPKQKKKRCSFHAFLENHYLFIPSMKTSTDRMLTQSKLRLCQQTLQACMQTHHPASYLPSLYLRPKAPPPQPTQLVLIFFRWTRTQL
jgi:hypothetical protein